MEHRLESFSTQCSSCIDGYLNAITCARHLTNLLGSTQYLYHICFFMGQPSLIPSTACLPCFSQDAVSHFQQTRTYGRTGVFRYTEMLCRDNQRPRVRCTCAVRKPCRCASAESICSRTSAVISASTPARHYTLSTCIISIISNIISISISSIQQPRPQI